MLPIVDVHIGLVADNAHTNTGPGGHVGTYGLPCLTTGVAHLIHMYTAHKHTIRSDSKIYF